MTPVDAKTVSPFTPVRIEWLAQRQEAVLEPDLAIIDAHHHLWERAECPYPLPALLSDTTAGHSVRATVFVECRAKYRRDGERTLRSIGETEFAVAAGEESNRISPRSSTRACAGVVGFVDLQVGGEVVDRLLEAHMIAGRGRFRGIRNISAWAPDAPSTAPARGLLLTKTFREGFARLAPRGLTFDAWMFHTQLADLRDLAEAFPDTTIVLNHVGGPIGIGPYANTAEHVFKEWSRNMRELAPCANVYLKLGGLGMPHCGFGFHEQPEPPSSQDLSDAWRPLIDICLRAFGPERCMFESNFPVDKASYSYVVVWNAFKRLTAGCSTQDREQLFWKTAANVYRLDA